MVPAQVVETAPKDVPNNVDSVPPKEEEKEPIVKPVDSVPNNIDAKPTTAEPVPETKIEEEKPTEQPAASEPDAPAPSESAADTEPVVEETPKVATPKPTKRKATKVTTVAFTILVNVLFTCNEFCFCIRSLLRKQSKKMQAMLMLMLMVENQKEFACRLSHIKVRFRNYS